MNMKVLKFLVGSSNGAETVIEGPVKEEINVETSGDLEKIRKESGPLVWLVKPKSLGFLRTMGPGIVDRGKKNKAVQLSRRLLEYEEIVLFDASDPKEGYTAGKHVKKGIRTFLKEAIKKNERNLYCIGINTQAFAELSQQAELTEVNQNSEVTANGKTTFEHAPSMRLQNDPDIWAWGQGEPIDVPPELEKMFMGSSPRADGVRRSIMQAAKEGCDVLILGETGTGKDVVAHAIHKFSVNHPGPFVEVNCAAIPSELFEEELFGLEGGIVTARKRPKLGLWEIAKNGTLFLDEIGDLRPNHQAAILKAIENKSIRRVGGEKEIPVKDARVICATHRNIFTLSESDEFRNDLCGRLGTMFQIETPRLRDEPELIIDLAQKLWKKINPEGNALLTNEVLEELKTYTWPRNIRQLKRVLKELHRQFKGKTLGVPHLHYVLQSLNDFGKRDVCFPIAGEVNTEELGVLDHLQRTYDRLQSIKVVMSELLLKIEEHKEVPAAANISTKQFLLSLEDLCAQPSTFGNEGLYLFVHQFKGKLAYFYALFQSNFEEAIKYWKKEAENNLVETKEAVTKQIKKLNQSAFESINTRYISLTPDLLELRERLAEHAHDVWVRLRRKKGWKYGRRRSDQRKEHPDLIPYKKLTDSEKDLDRENAMEILKAMVALGYRIEKS